MRRSVVRLSVLMLMFAHSAACDWNGSADEFDDVQLRVENTSKRDFSSVFIDFPGASADFGAVAAGDTTEYRRLERAYHYGYVEVVAEGDTFRLQPIDYVGEKPLANGHYTYALSIEGDGIGLDFRRD